MHVRLASTRDITQKENRNHLVSPLRIKQSELKNR